MCTTNHVLILKSSKTKNCITSSSGTREDFSRQEGPEAGEAADLARDGGERFRRGGRHPERSGFQRGPQPARRRGEFGRVRPRPRDTLRHPRPEEPVQGQCSNRKRN